MKISGNLMWRLKTGNTSWFPLWMMQNFLFPEILKLLFVDIC